MRFSVLLVLWLALTHLPSLGQNNDDNPVIIGELEKLTTTEDAVLSGKVALNSSGNVLQGVTVYIPELNKGTVTNSDGRYQISLRPGKYEVRFQFLGMETVVKNITVFSSGELNIRLKEKSLDMNEVIVRAKQEDNNVLGVVMGVENVSITDLEQLPALLGEVDVVNSLVMLPGVNTVGEGSAGFNVRGGRADQNLILMDGAYLFNSSHVLGLFSVYNPDVTNNYTLYKGHIPARFGGRLASVLDVDMNTGSMESFRLEGGIGIATARLLAEGPVIKDKTSFLLAGRSTYSDWILDLVKNRDVMNSNASFYDGNLNLLHRFNDNNKVELSLYGSHDKFQYSDEFGYSWSNRITNLKWTSLLGPEFVSEFSAIYGNYTSSYFDPSGIDAFNLDSGIHYYNTRANIIYQSGDNHTVHGGLELSVYHNDPETLAPHNAASTVAYNRIHKDHGRELAAYISDDITLTPALLLSLGLRYSYFQHIGPADVYSYQNEAVKTRPTITDTVSYRKGQVIKNFGGPEPRISLRYSLDSTSSVKLSYNRTRQYIHMISNNTAPSPADIWQVSNSHIPEQKANNYTFGYFKNFKSNTWETSAEVFYRSISGVAEYIDFAELFQNSHIETELIAGNGKAYGGELSIKKTTGKWTGWLSYSLTRVFSKSKGEVAEKRINQNEWFPSNYDQPHNINLAATRRLGIRSAFSANFTYRTGRPITVLTSNYVDNNTSIPVFSDRNKYRIPDYIRLDVSFTIAENIWKNRTVDPNRRYKDSMTISFYNLLGRKNAFSVFYKRPQNSTVPRAYKLSVLGTTIPSVTYNFSF